MKKPGHSLSLVTSALQGRVPTEADWPTVLKIANRAWLGPALYVALRRTAQLNEIPTPIRDYLSFLHERNCERNGRLRAQMFEAVRALNAQNIEPILLKGAVNLFTVNSEELGSRMISDLDLSIAPFEMTGAKSALMALGYQNAGNPREMARPDDVGVIELHDRPSVQSAPYFSNDLRNSSPRVTRDGAVARIPCAASRALHLIVHDMIKEGDYWSLSTELRHLQDLAELARSNQGIDWQRLSVVLSTRASRGALVAQAAALEDLFGVQIPPDLRPGRIAKLKHVVRLVRASNRGISGPVARLIGEMSRGLHRMKEGYTWRGGWNFTRQVYRRLTSSGESSRL